MLRAEFREALASPLIKAGYEKVVDSTWRRGLALRGDVSAQLVAVVEGSRNGGVSVTGTIKIVSSAVQQFFAESVPPVASWTDRSARSEAFLDLATFGELLTDGRNYDLQWEIRHPEDVPTVAALFVDTVSGVVEKWVEARSSVDQILRVVLETRLIDLSLFTGRTCVVFGLQHGRNDTSREIYQRMCAVPRLDPEDHQRLESFRDIVWQEFGVRL